jgi:hypothetical protein
MNPIRTKSTGKTTGKLPWKRPCKVVEEHAGFYILQCADGKKYIVLDTVLSDIPEAVEAIVRRAKEICPDCE